MPAEYGVDPTGFGENLGLTVLSSQSKESQPLAITLPVSILQTIETTCPDQTNGANNPANAVQKDQKIQPLQRIDSVMIIVPPKQGLEYKFHLSKGASLEYSWTTDGTKLYFDFHGEPKGDKTGYFKSFKESTDNQSSGDLTAPFEGSHGWYWENKTRFPVTIVLNTKGSYRILGLI
ncbi:MAG: hypothetical protein ACU83O_09185 [Gammaproteobacteria bacterium]